jgi:DNA-binding MarR family transcriptional regulator
MKDKYIVHFISKTKKRMIKFIEGELKNSELNDLIPTHGNVLTALYESSEKLTMKDIAQIISKDKSTVTPLINKLVKLGYIRKQKSDADGRVTFIELTEKGRAVRPSYENISRKINATAFNGFSDEEKKEFLRLLKKLNKNFKS